MNAVDIIAKMEDMEQGALVFEPTNVLKKRQAIEKAFPAQRPNEMQQALHDGFVLAFNIVERAGYNAKKAAFEARRLLLRLLSDTKTIAKSDMVAQGLIAGIVFCDEAITTGWEVILECLRTAYYYVSEAAQHLRQMEIQQTYKAHQLVNA
jgi:hypothetical protein